MTTTTQTKCFQLATRLDQFQLQPNDLLALNGAKVCLKLKLKLIHGLHVTLI